MRSALRHLSRQLPFLARMPAPERETLLAESTVLHLPARHQILTEGKPPNFLHFALDQPIELYAECGDKEATIGLVPAGEPFILAAVVKNAPCLMSARTIGKTSLLFMPADRFRDVLQRNPGLALSTTEELSRAFRDMVRQLRCHKLRTAKMRLAAFLLTQCKKGVDPALISLTIPKRMLASLLGLEPESLSRVFASLVDHGVRVHGDQIMIDDVKGLRSLAMYDMAVDEPD